MPECFMDFYYLEMPIIALYLEKKNKPFSNYALQRSGIGFPRANF